MKIAKRFIITHKGAAVKKFIASTQQSANKECRNLENDFCLKKYSLSAVFIHDVDQYGRQVK